jgi:tetratricopeptide (TPR) repeat protein
MTTYESITNQINSLLEEPAPTLVALRSALLDIEELISAPQYTDLASDEQANLQNLRKELKARLRSQEQPSGTAGAFQPADISPSASAASAKTMRPADHNTNAEEQMEAAEKQFYSGRYAEAIRLFDRVLDLEPGWERARQHRAEAEEYLRSGYIPAVALPAEAASAFGKAQSAARVGRYSDAMALLSKAQSVMREMGIQRWQEGLEFEQKLQESIDAENAYREGIKFFENGQIDEAIERVEAAAQITGMPRYTEKAQELRQVKASIRRIHENLSAPQADPSLVAQAKSDLGILNAQYGANPALEKIQPRLEAAVPRVITPLKDQAGMLKAQAERAATLEESLKLAQGARAHLDQVRDLGGMDPELDKLADEVDRLLREVQRYENELNLANNAYEANKNWPAQASRLSAGVRQRFPNDPLVAQLSRLLARYHVMRAALRAGLVILGLALIVLLGMLVRNRVQSYFISLTPTPTPTHTATLTATSTPTITATITPTPLPTATMTPTPTPLAATTLRDIWARSGCYEGYNALGRVPVGSQVRFLPAERRFDNFNRECALVEFVGEDGSVIGWVLLVDLGPISADE